MSNAVDEERRDGAMKTDPILRTVDLSKTFEVAGHKVKALQRANLEIMPGEFVAVMGPSGSGKTTLLTLLGCLDRPTGGVMLLDGTDVTKIPERSLHKIRREKVGFIFQTFNLIQNLSALENVELPMEGRIKSGAHRREKARELLALTEMQEREGHRPSQLSGGEQQRVAIARALANDPAILVADEPTGNLDSETGLMVINMLTKLAAEGKCTVIMVTHDRSMASFADRRVSLKDGRIQKVKD
jgi:putative ABC transport system ATP-binding protein